MGDEASPLTVQAVTVSGNKALNASDNNTKADDTSSADGPQLGIGRTVTPRTGKASTVMKRMFCGGQARQAARLSWHENTSKRKFMTCVTRTCLQ